MSSVVSSEENKAPLRGDDPHLATYPPSEHHEAGKQASILLIDDDEALRELLNMVLTDQGYRCYAAANGFAGLVQLRTNQPDLILLDIMMPGLDGFAVLAAIRQQDRVVGVIMLSAQPANPFADKVISAGADGYIAKPMRLQILLQEVERVNELVRLRRTHIPSC